MNRKKKDIMEMLKKTNTMEMMKESKNERNTLAYPPREGDV